ncbi:MAG: gliding motility lipoprotein GldH [Bacteroidetes bacterium]|nr:gliding motility lipoprotein GldH [Bacteroidota bacterium]
MNRKTIAFYTLAVMFVWLFTACDQEVTYAESQVIDKEGWLAGDTLTLSPSIASIDGTFDVYLWVRHTKEYDYSNIWLKVISDPMLTHDSTYMLEIPVADKMGRWLGHCTQSLCTVRVRLKDQFRFQEASAFKVDVLQYMRQDNLKDVRNIGMEIIPTIE